MKGVEAMSLHITHGSFDWGEEDGEMLCNILHFGGIEKPSFAFLEKNRRVEALLSDFDGLVS